MKLEILEYPGSYLVAELKESEKIVTEKGALMYSSGEYKLTKKFEIGGYKRWIAKVFGKSLTYNVYSAKDEIKMAFVPKANAELLEIQVAEDNPILFEPNLHFARTIDLDIKLEKQNLKSTLNDGLKLKTHGKGKLFLKGNGKIIQQEIDSDKPIYVDEDALIAFEEKIEIKTISKGVKQLLTSGEGMLFSIKGQGKIWIQTREKGDSSSSGGIIDEIFGFMK